MSQLVRIIVPAHCLDDPRYGDAVDYDQRIGRLSNPDRTDVVIDGEMIRLPKSWIHPINNNGTNLRIKSA